MTCHIALMVTAASLMVCVAVGSYANYRLMKKMADELEEGKRERNDQAGAVPG